MPHDKDFRQRLLEIAGDERFVRPPADPVDLDDADEELEEEGKGKLPEPVRAFLAASDGFAAPFAILYGVDEIPTADPDDPWPDIVEANLDEDISRHGFVIGWTDGDPILYAEGTDTPWRVVDALTGDVLEEATTALGLLEALAELDEEEEEE